MLSCSGRCSARGAAVVCRGLAARLVECRDEMDRDLTRLSHGCPTNSSQATTEPACRLRVLILSFHSYESSDATKYK